MSAKQRCDVWSICLVDAEAVPVHSPCCHINGGMRRIGHAIYAYPDAITRRAAPDDVHHGGHNQHFTEDVGNMGHCDDAGSACQGWGVESAPYTEDVADTGAAAMRLLHNREIV